MKKENRSHILLRYAVIIGLIFLFAGAVVYNSLDNTVLSAPKWNEKAMQELSRVVSLPPDRGNILANNGSILATNLCFYNIRIDYRSERFLEGRYLVAVDSLADSLAKHFPIRDKAGWKKRLMKPVGTEKARQTRLWEVMKLSIGEVNKLPVFR